MRRRDFIVLLGGTAAAWPIASRAQRPEKIPRVGVLWPAEKEKEDVYLTVLTNAFNDLGYVHGKSIQLEHRFSAEQSDRIFMLVRELVESKVDVILTVTGLGVGVRPSLELAFLLRSVV